MEEICPKPCPENQSSDSRAKPPECRHRAEMPKAATVGTGVPENSKAQAERSKKHFSISWVTFRYTQLVRVRVTVKGGHGDKDKKARSNVQPPSHYN